MMPTVKEIRARFKRHSGDERYAKFIKAIHFFAKFHGRLRHWQEILWGDFIATNPECHMSHDDLCATFRICELHGCELQCKTVPVVDGCVDYAREYERDMVEHFPHAARDFVSTEGRPKQSNREQIWYCPECDAVRDTTKWSATNPADKD